MLLNLSLLGSLSWPWILWTLRQRCQAWARLFDSAGRRARSDIGPRRRDE
jgi:hypothetical protein